MSSLLQYPFRLKRSSLPFRVPPFTLYRSQWARTSSNAHDCTHQMTDNLTDRLEVYSTDCLEVYTRNGYHQSKPFKYLDVEAAVVTLGFCTAVVPDLGDRLKMTRQVRDSLCILDHPHSTLDEIGNHWCNMVLNFSASIGSVRLVINFKDTGNHSMRSELLKQDFKEKAVLRTFVFENLDRGKARTLRYDSSYWFNPTSRWKTIHGQFVDHITITTWYNLSRASQKPIRTGKSIDLGSYRENDQTRVPLLHEMIYNLFNPEEVPVGTAQAYLQDLAHAAFDMTEHDPCSYQLYKFSIKTRINPAFISLTSILRRSEYLSLKKTMRDPTHHLNHSGVFIALGSNMGDRIQMIENACREMAKEGINVIRTSALYETEAMYVENQNPFLNGVCKIETTLGLLSLLDRLKAIENRLGRQKTIDKGPRTIDLDILLYDDRIVDLPNLTVPHKSMLEREFVLRPLCDLIPKQNLPPPQSSSSFITHLNNLPKPPAPLSPLTPLSPYLPSLTSLNSTRKTHIMAILNLTPDSFSDGGLHSTSPPSLLPTLHSFLAAGASILDIGGQSTRPNAPQITPSEELARVLPTISLIRADPAFNLLAISIDTYDASVATAAINAGANIINDVSAGRMDTDMLPTAARLGCTIILMHMRGTPETMNTLTSYPTGIIAGVATELLERVQAAEAAGIHRWRIILDPGIGFAKTAAQNLELLRRFDELRDWEGLGGLPWCVGTSRKGFIGKITAVDEAKERVMGTAGCVMAAVKGGADIVRVHDVKEMGELVKMGDALYRV